MRAATPEGIFMIAHAQDEIARKEKEKLEQENQELKERVKELENEQN